MVNAAIAAAARADGRRAEDVQLIAVSKTFDAGQIRPVLNAGHRVFGENRVQEAAGKWPGLREEYADIDLHLIGPLQSNKARQAVHLFDAIHTIDRPKIANAIAAEMRAQGKSLKLFVQVNTGEEAAEGRRRTGGRGRVRAALPRDAGIAGRGVDVHSAGRRGAGRALCAAR